MVQMASLPRWSKTMLKCVSETQSDYQAKREKIKQQKLVKKQNQMKLATLDLEFKVV